MLRVFITTALLPLTLGAATIAGEPAEVVARDSGEIISASPSGSPLGLAPLAAAQGDTATLRLGQSKRLTFDRDVRRVSVADGDVLRSEVLDSREVLITGATVGVTSLTIWFESGEPLEQLVTAHVTALRGTPCCDGD